MPGPETGAESLQHHEASGINGFPEVIIIINTYSR